MESEGGSWDPQRRRGRRCKETQASTGYPQENMPHSPTQEMGLEQPCWAGKGPDNQGNREGPSGALLTFLTPTCP